jgi:hypothetical protein
VTAPAVLKILDITPDITDIQHLELRTNFTAVQYNGRLDADVTGKDRIGFAIYWVPHVPRLAYNGYRAYRRPFTITQINDAFLRYLEPHLLAEPAQRGPLRTPPVGAGTSFHLQSAVAGWAPFRTGFGLDRQALSRSIQFGPNVSAAILDQWTYSYKDVATKIIGRTHH